MRRLMQKKIESERKIRNSEDRNSKNSNSLAKFLIHS